MKLMCLSLEQVTSTKVDKTNGVEYFIFFEYSRDMVFGFWGLQSDY